MVDDERIQHRAYEIWEKAGRPDGHHDAHWDQAFKEIQAEGTRPLPPADTSSKPRKKIRNLAK
jgi:hypothetical protein